MFGVKKSPVTSKCPWNKSLTFWLVSLTHTMAFMEDFNSKYGQISINMMSLYLAILQVCFENPLNVVLGQRVAPAVLDLGRSEESQPKSWPSEKLTG